MDTRDRCKSLPNPPRATSKLSRTFHKVITFNAATAKIASTPPFDNAAELRRRYHLLQALLAKLFAEITAIKAAYAELQLAQDPYRSEVIQAADQAVVHSLKTLSELKHRYLLNDVEDCSPQVTLMLAEIQEQQSLMKTYEITIKKLEVDSQAKCSAAFSLSAAHDRAKASISSLESQTSVAGAWNLTLKELRLSHFEWFLSYTIKSVKSFVKILLREMDCANWDTAMAVRAIEPCANLSSVSHRFFVLESFVCRGMLHGFGSPRFGKEGGSSSSSYPCDYYFGKFRKMARYSDTAQCLSSQNRDSSFSRFLKGKYFDLVHAKMECSLFGNLNLRKMIAGDVHGSSDDPFFLSFAEMAIRVWCLNLIGFSLGLGEVKVFQVRKGSRFSEVYMESVTEELCGGGGDLRVGFTVVPGFEIGRNVIQSQVYLQR